MAKGKLHSTANNLPARNREQVVALLNHALADLSDLHSQAKQAHWNVRGRTFFMLHELFDKLAGIVGSHLDDIAERATALGGTALGTVRMAATTSRVPEWPSDLKAPEEYVTALTSRFALVANSVREAIDAAAGLGDADTADLFTGVSRDLDKALWFLEAFA